MGFVLVPPAEELPVPVDRRVERYCPRGTKLCLIAQHRSSPLSSRPQPQNDNGEYDDTLAVEPLGWGHVGLLAKGAEASLRLLALLSFHISEVRLVGQMYFLYSFFRCSPLI